MKFPNKKYSVIYADPPWPTGIHVHLRKAGSTKPDKNHYPLMTKTQIRELDVQSICADDCVLYLWACSPQLDVALEVMKSWGFKYVTVGFVWEKMKPVIGTYTMSSCELVLIGTRGKINNIPRAARNIRQFLQEKKTYHSKKPDEIINRISSMYHQSVRKIELFARSKHKGWDCWGNEV